MAEPSNDGDLLWECGWEGHRSAQLRRMAGLPLSEKLQWLEEAQRLAEQIQASRRLGPESQDTCGITGNPQPKTLRQNFRVADASASSCTQRDHP